jgi:hypothetical protein
MAISANPYAANRAEQQTASAMEIICTIRFCDDLSRWVQPPDAESRMSVDVGGIMGEIQLFPPDRVTSSSGCLTAYIFCNKSHSNSKMATNPYANIPKTKNTAGIPT